MGKVDAVIVDLDGTLSLNQYRYHYIYPDGGGKPDWDGFFLACSEEDKPNIPVVSTIKALKNLVVEFISSP